MDHTSQFSSGGYIRDGCSPTDPNTPGLITIDEVYGDDDDTPSEPTSVIRDSTIQLEEREPTSATAVEHGLSDSSLPIHIAANTIEGKVHMPPANSPVSEDITNGSASTGETAMPPIIGDDMSSKLRHCGIVW